MCINMYKHKQHTNHTQSKTQHPTQAKVSKGEWTQHVKNVAFTHPAQKADQQSDILNPWDQTKKPKHKQNTYQTQRKTDHPTKAKVSKGEWAHHLSIATFTHPTQRANQQSDIVNPWDQTRKPKH